MSNVPHGMPCPICEIPLVMSERQGVEVDYCPKCRGVWLDRGELDKIIERSAADTVAPAPAPSQPYPPAQPYPSSQPYPQAGYSHGRPKRRKSFLEELFD